MSTPPKPTPLRPLSHIELFSSTRHHLGIYRCVVVTCRYQLPASSPDALSPDRLYAALGRVVAAEPMLRVGILGQDTSSATFSHVPEVDLRKQVDVRGVLDGVASAAEYEARLADIQGWRHDQLWANIETQPPWQLIVAQPPSGLFTTAHVDLVFGFHHSLADGTSGKAFHERLLTALQQSASEPTSSPDNQPYLLSFPEPPVLPEALQDVIAYRYTARYTISTIWGAMGPSWLQARKQRIWHGQNIDFALKHITRVLPVDAEPAVLTSLLKACKAHSTSLTGLTHALAFASLARRLPAEAAPAFACSTPINVRPYLLPSANPEVRDAMRVLISSTEHQHSPAVTAGLRSASAADLDAAIWASAARIKDELAQRTATLPENDIVGLMKHISDWFGYWSKKDGQARSESWEVSNIGVIKPLPASPATAEALGSDISITRILFTNGSMVAGPAIGLGVGSVAGGALTIALSWQEGVVEEDVVKGLAEDLQSFMTRLHTTGKFAE